MRSRRGAVWVAVLAGVLAATRIANGQKADDELRARATVEPVNVRLGEPARYRAVVLLPPGTSHARWVPPKNDDEWTWGPLSPQRIRSVSSGDPDTLVVETTVQSFRTGTQMVPGIKFEAGKPGAVRTHKVPDAALSVIPMLSAADSNADLRPPRGPAAAPWWETVPWHWVVLAVVVLAAAYALFRWWRARARRVQPGVAPAVDPAAAALAELAALRGLHLPAHGRFAEHAFQLTRIIRRYLEVMVHAPRPGHTSSELMAALERSRLSDDDRRMLSALLRVWDRIKFARAASSVEESTRSEEVVEQLIRQLSRPAPTTADAGGKAA